MSKHLSIPLLGKLQGMYSHTQTRTVLLQMAKQVSLCVWATGDVESVQRLCWRPSAQADQAWSNARQLHC